MTARKPVPLAERVGASVERALERGARRTPRGVLPPEAAAALQALLDAGYAPNATACIARALREAAATHKEKPRGNGAS